jgi:hypothetical protein
LDAVTYENSTVSDSMAAASGDTAIWSASPVSAPAAISVGGISRRYRAVGVAGEMTMLLLPIIQAREGKCQARTVLVTSFFGRVFSCSGPCSW